MEKMFLNVSRSYNKILLLAKRWTGMTQEGLFRFLTFIGMDVFFKNAKWLQEGNMLVDAAIHECAQMSISDAQEGLKIRHIFGKIGLKNFLYHRLCEI